MRLPMRLLALSMLAVVASAWPIIRGPSTTMEIRPWCQNSLRVRIVHKDEGSVKDELPGALVGNKLCGNEVETDANVTNNSITYGSLTATWDDTDGLRFMNGGELLLSTGPRAFSIIPATAPSPSPGPGPPKPFACQDSCTLGSTGIVEQTDATQCQTTGLQKAKLLNISRSACCSACASDTKCAAWAWGRDTADSAHHHNCYLCSSVSGTIHRSDRDFGCVERTQNSFKTINEDNQTQYYKVGASFQSDTNEFLTGLGQHSAVPKANCTTGKGCGQFRLNQKGFTWDLRITKFQIMVPLLVSSRRYGFFWNAPGDGTVQLADAATVWNSTLQRQIDFWVTAAPSSAPSAESSPLPSEQQAQESPAESPFAAVMRQYADATGHAPVLPDYATGFWQSKMRYRTTDELLDVAAGYQQRNVPLSVLVIDFYSWTKFGDFRFDERCWPNATQATELLAGQGVRLLRSTYPWVDKTSLHFAEAKDKAFLATTAAGDVATVAPDHDALLDPLTEAARRFVWSKVNASFFEQGIDMFWLDDTEPNVRTDGLVYACGPAEYCGALWSNAWVQTFSDGVTGKLSPESDGATSTGTRVSSQPRPVEVPVMLTRAGWAGIQTSGAVLWSSDIPSTFESLRVQLRAGLNTMMSGIPWWTTDIGGFAGGDGSSPEFRELLVRWYQYGACCPIFRTHGSRAGPMAALPASGSRFDEQGLDCDAPGGHASGGPNEIWTFGSEVEGLLTDVIALRESLRAYIAQLARAAAVDGTPPMRPLFFDFHNDPKAWSVDDQFMLGPTYLVAPVLEYGARDRSVYFPCARYAPLASPPSAAAAAAGKEGDRGGTRVEGSTSCSTVWRHHFTNATYNGGTAAVVAAPLSTFPLFARVQT